MADDRWLSEELAARKIVDPGALVEARARQRRAGGDLALNLVAVGAIDEATLLREVSLACQTGYITSEKLARARIEPWVLDLLPEPRALELNALPIRFDRGSRTLSVVTGAPGDPEVLAGVRATSGAAEVRAYLGLHAAVEAAIARHYRDDPRPFARLPGGPERPTPSDIGPPRHAPPDDLAHTSPLARLDRTPPPPAGPDETPEPAEPLDELSHAEPPSSVRAALDGEAVRTGGVAALAHLAAVLVGAHERGLDGARQDHSAQVAALVDRLCERVGLGERERSQAALAAHLHELGKPSGSHLSLLRAAEDPEAAALAERLAPVPGRLLAGPRFPEAVLETLGALYERYGGGGCPTGRAGRVIPLAARVIALADAFVDGLGGADARAEAAEASMSAITATGEALFDPNLVALLAGMITGDDLRARLAGDRPRLLIIDGDVETSTIFEVKLAASGFDVRLARTTAEAARVLLSWPVDLVLSEVALRPVDGFQLLERLRADRRTSGIPVVFVTERADGRDVDRGLRLGAADYVVKPCTPEVLLAKIRVLLAQRARAAAPRGVAGSLSEMSVPDIVQVLSNGRKTGALELAAPGRGGEIFFHQGRVVHALCGALRGEDAFYALLTLESGEFEFDPDIAVVDKAIDLPTEALLLEGMRRIDEGAVR